MTRLLTRQPRLDPTLLSATACEHLPAMWCNDAPSLSLDDVTVFHSYSLSMPRPTNLTRTWLLSEIGKTEERVESAITRFETHGSITWDLHPPATPRSQPSLRTRSLSAINRLMDVLSMSESRVADIARVSRNSVRNWRNGHDVYPATVIRLLQISSLLGALEEALGRDGLLAWLAEPEDGSRPRRALLAEPEGPASLAKAAAGILFQRPASTLPPQHLLGEDPELADERDASEYAPHAFAARQRRQRPNPPGHRD